MKMCVNDGGGLFVVVLILFVFYGSIDFECFEVKSYKVLLNGDFFVEV